MTARGRTAAQARAGTVGAVDDPELRPLLPRRLRRGELVALDALAAAGYTLATLTPAAAGGRLAGGAVALAAAGIGLPLVLRRRWPWPVFGVVLAASLAGIGLGVVRDPLLAAAFALYPVALTTPRRRREPTVGIAVASLAGVVLVVLAGPVAIGVSDPDAGGVSAGSAAGLVLLGCVFLAGAWTLGRVVRERRAYAARYAEQLADRAATEERLRIARDLHDVVSHTLSLIGVKAGIANHVADARPAETREALQVIETTSREALVEMRRMLGLLRADQSAGGDLAALPALAEQAARAGVPVELALHGGDRLPEPVARSAYRIVQEAVTNAVKHAAPTRCRVLVKDGGDGVRVEVTDDGPEGDPPAQPRSLPGHGLIGMRERAAAHGGTFTAGPRPAGGFAVSAWLPYLPAEAA
jgi:signal transduction histidine kinase